MFARMESKGLMAFALGASVKHRQRLRLLALLRPKLPAVRGQALAGVACRRRQKKYESPQNTPVAAAQPHAEELGPRDAPPASRRGIRGG